MLEIVIDCEKEYCIMASNIDLKEGKADRISG